MFKGLHLLLAVAVVFTASLAPVSAQAAEGGNTPSASSVDPDLFYSYELWVREEGTHRWWLWNTYDHRSDAEWIAGFFEQYGYDTYIVKVSIFDSYFQSAYAWD